MPQRRSLALQALDAFSREQLKPGEPHQSWSAKALAELSVHVHAQVESGTHLPPGTFGTARLDVGAQDQLWRESVVIDGSTIRVPMRQENSELSVLAGVTGMYLGGVAIAVGGPVIAMLGGFLAPAGAPDPFTNAMSLGILNSPMLMLSVLMAILGALVLLTGAFVAAQAIQTYELRIGRHGVDYDGRRMTYDEILAVRADRTQLCFELLDGSDFHTPPDMLDPDLAVSLASRIRALLPDESERAAGFVAYEKARRAFAHAR